MNTVLPGNVIDMDLRRLHKALDEAVDEALSIDGHYYDTRPLIDAGVQAHLLQAFQERISLHITRKTGSQGPSYQELKEENAAYRERLLEISDEMAKLSHNVSLLAEDDIDA